MSAGTHFLWLSHKEKVSYIDFLKRELDAFHKCNDCHINVQYLIINTTSSASVLLSKGYCNNTN